MALSDIQIRNLQPSDKDQWITDEKGLRLLVKKNGSKYWRLKYRFQGIQKTLALGVYPTTTLKEARELCIDAKRDVAKGVDPGAKKQQEKYDAKINFDNSFEILAREWWEQQKGTWTEDHAKRVWSRLKDNSFKVIGHLPINDITPQIIISTIRVIEKRDALDVAQRVLQDIRRVCRYAVQTCRLLHNPASELSDILKSRKTSHRASLPLEELPQFMKALSTYEDTGRLLTKYALQLLILTFVRPGELRGARWDEFDFEDSMWRIPGERMKMGTDHLVPLSKQALSVI
jgi:integrase